MTGNPSPDESAEKPTGIADGVARSLDPKYVDCARIVAWITTASFTGGWAISLGILLLTPTAGWVKWLVALVWIPVFAGLAWLSHRWPEIEHRYVSYTVLDLGIEIRRGVIFRSVINVPRSRVQHTDVSQGPLERRFDLGTLRIYTAGTEHAEVALHGLGHETALRIRDHLLVSGGDDAV